MAATEKLQNIPKGVLRDTDLSAEITATAAGASTVFDTKQIKPAGKMEAVRVSVVANEAVTIADTDTLKLDIQCAADSTGDTDTLFSETYTEAGGGSTLAAGDELVGVRASGTAAYTFFTDVLIPPTATQYIKFTLTANNGGGADDKKFQVSLVKMSSETEM